MSGNHLCRVIFFQYFIMLGSMALIYYSLYHKVELSPRLPIRYEKLSFMEKLNGGCDGRTLHNQRSVMPHWKSVGHAGQGFLSTFFILIAPLYFPHVKNSEIYGTIISATGAILGSTYQIYNYVKRTGDAYADGAYFAYSSYYVNLLDLFIGMIFGSVFGTSFLLVLVVVLCMTNIKVFYHFNSGIASCILLVVTLIILVESERMLESSAGIIKCTKTSLYYSDNNCNSLCELLPNCPHVLVTSEEFNATTICS